MYFIHLRIWYSNEYLYSFDLGVIYLYISISIYLIPIYLFVNISLHILIEPFTHHIFKTIYKLFNFVYYKCRIWLIEYTYDITTTTFIMQNKEECMYHTPMTIFQWQIPWTIYKSYIHDY